MNIEELIEELVKIRDSYGVVPVAIKDGEMNDYRDIEGVEIFEETEYSKLFVGVK